MRLVSQSGKHLRLLTMKG
ncbi:hypothetical protein Gotur_029357 [Gossypium turneri]